MPEKFDTAAANYDTTFTHTAVGKLQRNRVYFFLEKFNLIQPSHSILEINCGTGEDAIWLADRCKSVLASDVSEEMLKVASCKAQNRKNIDYRKLDLNDFKANQLSENFDVVFSNFGGLNCISPDRIKSLLDELRSALKKKGRMALVIMPKKTFMERLYFRIKGQKEKVFRRNTTEAIIANVEGNMVPTWYYDPIDIKKYVQPHFKVITTKPIGLLVPPSYLDSFFKTKKNLLSFLGWIDRRLDFFNNLSSYADHFIIILEKK